MNKIEKKIDDALSMLRVNPNRSLLLVGKLGDGKIHTLMNEHKLDVVCLSQVTELPCDVIRKRKLVVLDEIDRASHIVMTQALDLMDIEKKQLIFTTNVEPSNSDKSMLQIRNRCITYIL